MIKQILVICVFLPFILFSQNKSLTYDQTQNIKISEKYKNYFEIESYLTKDGFTINIGDTLTIGNAAINRDKYLFSDVFSYIVIGHKKGFKGELRPLPHNYSSSKIIVHSIFVTHEKLLGFKLWPKRNQTPLYVSLLVKNHKESSTIFSYSRKTILDIERAFSSGEIINYNASLSFEQAIKKLKDSKDLMELDFLSKEDYDSIRNKLAPIILEYQKKE